MIHDRVFFNEYFFEGHNREFLKNIRFFFNIILLKNIIEDFVVS